LAAAKALALVLVSLAKAKALAAAKEKIKKIVCQCVSPKLFHHENLTNLNNFNLSSLTI